MASAYDDCVRASLTCAQQFKINTCRTANEFKNLRNRLLQSLQATVNVNGLENNGNISDRFQKVSDAMIDEHAITNRPAIVVFGANSSGKTSFIQRFVGIDNILPSDFGPVTARIVQLTYAQADQASFRVYDSIEKTKVLQQIDLSGYFKDPNEPDWKGIANEIFPHVQRPTDIQENSPEFAEWAKYFITISLPSDVLSLGIDVYDTPGFLSDNREQVLTDNLHTLVKRIRPTLLFLYDNATISDTDKSCFLAMKNALGSMERVAIFFLNTKADCMSIANDFSLDDDPDNVPLDQFKDVLHKKRQRCYELLLKRNEMANERLGRAPDSITKCTFFDICTIPGDYDPWETYTNLINTTTFQRIVQYVVESYSETTLTLAEDILHSVEDYFDMIVSTTVRLPHQWEALRQEAVEWGEKFFDEYESIIPDLINELYSNIMALFGEVKTEIIRQAAPSVRTNDPIDALLRDNAKTVRDYVRLAVQEQIIKVAANKAITNRRDQVKELIANHFQQKPLQPKNELLSLSQREVLNEISAETLQQTKVQNNFLAALYTIQMRFTRFRLSLPTRLSAYRKDLYNRFVQKQVMKDKAEDVFELLDAMDAYATLSNEAGRRKLAEHCLTEIENDIRQKKDQFGQNLYEWVKNQRAVFNQNIQTNYKYITEVVSKQQNLMHNIITPFVRPFVKIECQLQAAIELKDRKGILPILGEEIGRGGFYSVHAIQWGSETNLAAKKLLQLTNDNVELCALEAHYHRIATRLKSDCIAPLLALYENLIGDNQRELWLVMPRYPMSLRQYLQRNNNKIEFVRVVSFALIIANVLADLHRSGVVHRDLKASNIMLDEHEQCYLIDFGTAQFGLAITTVVGTFPFPPEIIEISVKGNSDIIHYNGTAADVYAFGILLYEMLPKPTYDRLTTDTILELEQLLNTNPPCDINTNAYKDLIRACLNPNPSHRPTTAKLISELQTILKRTEVKPCMACDDRDRDIRFEPCRHKVMCRQCWQSWSTTENSGGRCILCKAIVTGQTQDDSNATFYPQKN